VTSELDKSDVDSAIVREDLRGIRPEPTYGGVLSFARRRYTKSLAGADVAICGIPFDTATTNRPGARMGPRGIRAASTILAWERPYGMRHNPFDALAVVDYGDLHFDFGYPADTPEHIETQAFEIIDQGVTLLGLGGDHFISYPLLKAHARKYGKPLSLLHFDAHSDTWSEPEERIDHGTMFYHAARQGIVDPESSVQIGIRTTNPDTHGFNILDAPWVHDNGVNAVVASTRDWLGNRPVYLTFDIDCLDPAFAPGTGTPVCGGLSTHQASSILRGLEGINVVGMDVVEVAPAYDSAEITSLAAAHLAMEMLNLRATRHPAR
jgi:agmatinase